MVGVEVISPVLDQEKDQFDHIRQAVIEGQVKSCTVLVHPCPVEKLSMGESTRGRTVDLPTTNLALQSIGPIHQMGL